MSVSNRIIRELAVTAELCGTEISEAAAQVMCAELSAYPENVVLGALSRLRREHQGRFTLAAIISRLDDGRPGVEEAWALYPKTESESAAVTTEMQEAMYAAGQLLADGDRIGARMAFKEAYERLVSQNRGARVPVQWQVTLGFDKAGREAALIDATTKGLIGVDHAMKLLPEECRERFCGSVGRLDLLPSPDSAGIERVRQIMGELAGSSSPISQEENQKRMAKLRAEVGL